MNEYRLYHYDRVLLHLLLNCPKPTSDNPTFAMTQDGIADAVLRTRGHVSSTLREMATRGLVTVECSRIVDGRNRRVAKLTPLGIDSAKRLVEKLERCGMDPKESIKSPETGKWGGRSGADITQRIARIECELADLKRLMETI